MASLASQKEVNSSTL